MLAVDCCLDGASFIAKIITPHFQFRSYRCWRGYPKEILSSSCSVVQWNACFKCIYANIWCHMEGKFKINKNSDIPNSHYFMSDYMSKWIEKISIFSSFSSCWSSLHPIGLTKTLFASILNISCAIFNTSYSIYICYIIYRGY